MKQKLKNLKSYLKRKQKRVDGTNTQSSNVHAPKDILGDQLSIQTLKNSEQSNIVQQVEFVKNITKLPLNDFIDCVVNKNYKILLINKEQDINEEEFLNAWIVILSQYQDARKDEKTRENLEIRWKMQQLKVRAEVINLLLNTTEAIYSKALVNAIKELDEEFSQFLFSEESIEEDLKMIRNIEINNEIEYTSLVEQLKSLEEEIGLRDKLGNIIEKKDVSEIIFYDYVASYNEIFKTSHSVERLNTMEYARMVYRHDKYVEEINLQNKK